VTPEGVPLALALATLSDRAAAFAIDAVIIVAGIIAVIIATVIAGPVLGIGAQIAIMAAGSFAFLNLYFVWFELRSSGRTPGKKAVGIRVVSRSGGPLRAEAVIARNLARDVEVFLPAAVVLFPPWLDVEYGWTWVLATGWVLVLALLPAFNRDRLRVGDVIGGTWVVRAPRVALERDLTAPGTAKSGGHARTPVYEFTLEQMDVYGVYELQTLEDVLRSDRPGADALREAVAAKIVRKLRYRAPPGFRAQRFLKDFYAALRAHHERRVLFGRRKERKGD
jgi:uncharacterized RDD family membrane protein YckC